MREQWSLPTYPRSAAQSGIGTTLSPDLGFLLGANVGAMNSPEMTWLNLEFSANITTGAGGGFPGRTHAQVAQLIQLADATGPRFIGLGSTMRQVCQREYGMGQLDNQDIAASQAGINIVIELRVPFQPRRSRTPHAFRAPVADFIPKFGGKLDVVTNTATGISANVTINTLSLLCYGEVVDGGDAQDGGAKLRQAWIEYGMTTADNPYGVNGLLMDLWIRARDADIYTPTTLAAQSFISGELGLASHTSSFLNDYYFKSVWDLSVVKTITAVGPIVVDDVAQGFAHNVFSAPKEFKFTQLKEFSTVQVSIGTGTAPTGGRVVVSAITKRNNDAVARASGWESMSAALAAKAAPSLKGENGAVSLSAVPPHVIPYAPVILRAPGGSSKAVR